MKSNSAQTNRLLFDVEALERRELLAGNVSAVVTAAGDLRINGDAQDNNIQVSTPTPGFVTVTGEFGTTVNGSTNPVNLSLINFGGTLSDDVFINLRGGDDSVIIGEILGTTQIADQLVINSGSGNDTIGVYDVLASDLRIAGGSGDDAIAVVKCSIIESVKVSTAGGEDSVYFDCSFASNNARINTGGGNDGIFFASSATKLLVATGGGNDLVALGNTLLGVGEGRFVLGGGDDLVAASDTASFDTNPVNGGGGEDSVLIGPSFAFQDADLNVEINIVSSDANTVTIAAVAAFQVDWAARGMSPLIFVC